MAGHLLKPLAGVMRGCWQERTYGKAPQAARGMITHCWSGENTWWGTFLGSLLAR